MNTNLDIKTQMSLSLKVMQSTTYTQYQANRSHQMQYNTFQCASQSNKVQHSSLRRIKKYYTNDIITLIHHVVIHIQYFAR